MASVNEFRATRTYHDSTFNSPAVKLLPNEFYVTGSDIMLTTVLGSCVSACLRDPLSGVGGMNHFMLPEGNDTSSPASASMRYGAYAMEVLINEMLKAGAARERLEAKVFGGGAVLSAMQQTHIGKRNAEFVLQYLAMESIPVRAQDLTGTHARRINFFPSNGKVMVRKMNTHQHGEALIAQREQALAASVKQDLQQPRRDTSIARRPAMAW